MAGKYIKLSSKNQITLPRSVVKHFPGTEFFEVALADNMVTLRPAHMEVHGETLKKVRDKIKNLGLDQSIILEAIEDARKNKR